ncbi:MAG TPA: pitrilysin family protein [Rhodocyclaceae bacterium]|jgi:zinc protease|nr:pitrilysin family protein [Rhodocyclaceae bacterium]
MTITRKLLQTATLAATLACGLVADALAGPAIQHWTAPSGAQVYFIENHDLPMLDVSVDFAAGTLYAPADKTGLAGLTNGLLDNGAGPLNEDQIAETLVNLGANLGSSADSDRAGVTLRTLSSPKEKTGALALLRTLLAHPNYPEDVLTREKSRTIAALQEADTRPDAVAGKRFASALYGDHPYGRTATVDSVSRITRDDLLTFHRRFYTARRAVVALIGDIPRSEAEAIAQQLTEDLPKSDEADAPLPPVRQPQAQTLRIAHPAAQSHILVGQPANRRDDPDFFPLLVGNYVLGGGGFVSRLMTEVREKRGYAYDVHSYFSPRKQEGPFTIGLQTRRDQADAALKVVNEVLIKFLKDGPTEGELKAAKQNIADGFALRTDSNGKLLGFLAAIGFYNLPLTYLDDYPAKVKAVTAKQVKEAFNRKVQAEHLVTVVVAADSPGEKSAEKSAP